jgi:hypothetical protein
MIEFVGTSLPFSFQWLFQSIQGPGLSFNSVIIFFKGGSTLQTNDQLLARPLPKHRTTQTQNKRIHTPNIHALSSIRTHDPSDRTSEDIFCLRLRGYCDRHLFTITVNYNNSHIELLLDDICLTNLPEESLINLTLWTKSKSKSNLCYDRRSVDQPLLE